jgi:hypothetical protein
MTPALKESIVTYLKEVTNLYSDSLNRRLDDLSQPGSMITNVLARRPHPNGHRQF